VSPACHSALIRVAAVVHGVCSAPAPALQSAPAAHLILAALKQIFDCVFISCSAQDILTSASSSFEQCVMQL
jgi:hypothetical protein